MEPLVTRLFTATVHVRDISKARQFYRDVLGLHELVFDPKAERAVYAIPETTTTLSMHVQRPGEGGREPGTVSGLHFSHPDPVAACAEIRRRGGTITDEPVPVEIPGVPAFTRGTFADPDGNEFLISNRT